MAEVDQESLQLLLATSTSIGHLVQQVARLLDKSDLFYGHGTDNPDDEAYSLVFSTLDLSFDDAQACWNRKPDKAGIHRVAGILEQRINQRIPLPYLTGIAWFAGLPFHVDQRALIPRSPFAELILQAFYPWIQSDEPLKVLDMCTGNGCIGIAIAHHMPNTQVDIVDLSAEALQLARMNVELHQVAERVEITQSDLFDSLAGRQYDLIVSNPPYVPASSMRDLPVEYQHEPLMALQADNEGLAIVDRILHQADRFLKKDGCLIVEVGEIEQAVHERYASLPFVWLEFEFGGEGVFLLHKHDLKGLHDGKS